MIYTLGVYSVGLPMSGSRNIEILVGIIRLGLDLDQESTLQKSTVSGLDRDEM